MSQINEQEISPKDIYAAILRVERSLTDHSDQLFTGLKQEILGFGSKLTELQEVNSQCQQRLDLFEKLRRKNNLVIFGLCSGEHLDQIGLLQKVRDLFQTKLDVAILDSEVNNIYFIGRSRQVVKLELVTYLKKVEILRSARKLKGTKISIVEDLNKEEQSRQKVLRDHLRQARDKKYRAYIRGGFLYVDGERYTAKQLEAQPLQNFVAKPHSAPATPSRGCVDDKGDTFEKHTFAGNNEREPEVCFRESQSRASSVCDSGTSDGDTRVGKETFGKKILRSNSVRSKGNSCEYSVDKTASNSVSREREATSGKTSTPLDSSSGRKIKGG